MALSRFDATALTKFIATKKPDCRTETAGHFPPGRGARCGRIRRDAADDPGVGTSTLNKLITPPPNTDVVSKEAFSRARGNARRRRETPLLSEESDVLNGTGLRQALVGLSPSRPGSLRT